MTSPLLKRNRQNKARKSGAPARPTTRKWVYYALFSAVLGVTQAACQLIPERDDARQGKAGKGIWTNEKLTPGGEFLPGDGLPEGDAQHIDFATIPDATPRPEALSKTGNQPYTVFGETYQPQAHAEGYVEQGMASWYGTKFHGRRTSSGEPYDMFAMTAAHRTLPLPSYARVTNLSNQRSVVVRVNDRGPFIDINERVIDLSYAAAGKLGLIGKGTARVRLEGLTSAGEVGAEHTRDESNAVHKPTPASTKAAAATSAATPSADHALSQTPWYYVQVGAFAVVENAIRLQKKLTSSGFKTRIKVDGRLRKVQVGPYPGKAEAQRGLSRIIEVNGSGAQLVAE